MNQPGIGVVIIGRNEGERLRRCLLSVRTQVALVVYVDSGSSDGSVALAETLGVEVVRLDMNKPFTAARARNEGFACLRQRRPDLAFVQFVDGDCEVVDTWVGMAVEFLEANANVAAVCGRRRERFPERSIYNALCDAEWDTPVGETRSCGGDAMMRIDALVAVGGFNGRLIAGEEPELCVRLRKAGYLIWRLDAEMTLHDAAITRFGQWWKRAMRGGYAFAQGAHLHGAAPEYHCVRPLRRLLFWGLALPLLIVIVAGFFPFGFSLALVYPAQVLRLAVRADASSGFSWQQAFFLVLSKFPETAGAVKFWLHRITGRSGRLIEYK